MKSNWQTLKLNEIAHISAGGDVPKECFSKEKTSIFNVPIISNGVGDEAIYGYTTIKKISEPCITVAARGTIGYTAFREEPFYPIIRLICIMPNRKKTDPKYLYYQLSNIRFAGTSAGISQLTVPMISRYKVKLPDLKTQQKIAQILDTWTNSIELIKKEISNANKHMTALSRELLSNHSSATNEYKLADLCNIKKGSGLSKDILTDSGIPCILYGELYTHYDYLIDSIQSKTPISTAGVKSSANDILVPGSTTTNGKDLAIASVVKMPDVLLGGDINILRVKNQEIVDSVFLALYLRYIKWREMAARAQGITIVHLYGKDLSNITVELPTIQIQRKIVSIINLQREKISCLKEELKAIERQYKYLLNHLINGDFDSSNIKLENGKEYK